MTATEELFLNSKQFENAVEHELNSYAKVARFIENKIKENAIDNMVQEYFSYINNVNCDSKPNNSIKLVWKMHLLHPRIYRKDCFKRFGRMIIPNDLQLTFDSSTNNSHKFSPQYKNEKVPQFTALDLKTSLRLHYKFLQKILAIPKDNINIKQWILNYTQFMALIGANSNKYIVKPTVETDLIWHTHMLYPNIYFKESLILANGKFVKHIIDLKDIKKENIKNEFDENKIKNKNNNMIYYSLICISLILAVIISYKYTQNNYTKSVPNLKIFATTTPADISCTSNDNMLCEYITGLHTIFTITDRLRTALNQSEIDEMIDDITENDNDGRIIFFNSNPISNEIFANSRIPPTQMYPNGGSIASPFYNAFKLKTLTDLYGDEICEQSDVKLTAGPLRVNKGECRGWIYVSDADITVKETASTQVTDQNGGYAILLGSIVDLNDDKWYYLYVNELAYANTGCSGDSSECGLINAQMVLGNALFFISILGYDHSDTDIWLGMNKKEYYFDKTLSDYEYYVFVNRYSTGYRYVHPDTSKRNTATSLNNELRVGGDNLYGDWIDYVRSNGEKKRSYIIGPYPDVVSGARLYVGSGYSISDSGSTPAPNDGSGSGSKSKTDPIVWYLVIGGGVCLIIFLFFMWRKCNSSGSSSSNVASSNVTKSSAPSTYATKSSARSTYPAPRSARSTQMATTTTHTTYYGGGGGGCG
eukprot:530038_1